MALFWGTKKVAPIINIANTIRNQDKTITVDNTNCTTDQVIECDNDSHNYTGLGTITVHPDLNITSPSETIEHNGSCQFGNNNGLIRTINVTVNVPLEQKTYQIQEAELVNDTIVITPSNGYDGMSQITIDLSEITRLLSEI